MSEMTDADEIRSITLEVNGETFQSGTSTGLRLVPTVVGESEAAGEWVALAQETISRERTGAGIKHALDEEGDRLTLGNLLDRNDLSVADLRRLRDLHEFDVAGLAVGEVVTWEDLRNGESQETRRGVVSDIETDTVSGTVSATVRVGDHEWTTIETQADGPVRIGRRNMMGEVHDLRVVDKSDLDDELTTVREQVRDSAGVDEAAEECTVTVEETGAESSAEGTDHHATVMVEGPLFDAPVTVHCRNVFDGGWVASVQGTDLDERAERVAIRAARHNSPIPTEVRL